MREYNFLQDERQKAIYEFWSVRGYSEIKAILGNLCVSFNKNSRYETLGLSYIDLEQFYFWSIDRERSRIKTIIEETRNECNDYHMLSDDINKALDIINKKLGLEK